MVGYLGRSSASKFSKSHLKTDSRQRFLTKYGQLLTAELVTVAGRIKSEFHCSNIFSLRYLTYGYSQLRATLTNVTTTLYPEKIRACRRLR